MTNAIHIVLSSDNNYARHMGVVVMSLLANTAHPKRLNFFFLDAGISEENRKKLGRLTGQYGATYQFITPDSEVYNNIPHKRYGIAALFRLSLGNLLPTGIERAIYLDCDVLAFDDIEGLWETALGENIVGAVVNLGHQPVERMGIADGEYFNSGVLLIDLKKWRDHQVGEKTLTYMNENAEDLVFPDQDGLNHALRNRWQHIHLRWNLQPASYSMYQKKKVQPPLSLDDYHEAITAPGLVHYLANNKPWNYMTFHPLRKNYWLYLAHTPWSGVKPDGLSVANVLVKRLMLGKLLKQWLRRLAISAATRNKGL